VLVRIFSFLSIILEKISEKNVNNKTIKSPKVDVFVDIIINEIHLII
jgi:hypothetical protein